MRLDNHDISQIFCFPLQHHVSLGIDPPLSMNLNNEDMVMAILPYMLDIEELSKNPWTNFGDCTQYPFPKTTDKSIKINAGQLLTHSPYYHLASSMLKFSPKLLEYIAHPVHRWPYTIWWGKETQLKHGGCTGLEVKVRDRLQTRIIFIHLSALQFIHYFPDFVDWRAKEHQIQFYLYGSDSSTHLNLWGVHKIWPCGKCPLLSGRNLGLP